MNKERILLMMRTDAFPDIEVDWNNWFDNQHIPSRLNIPGFISARRFVAIEGEPKYLTLYELTSVDVLTSEAYRKLQDWEASLPSDSFEAIFQKLPNSSRGLYRQVYPKQEEYQMPNTEFIFAVGHDVPSIREEEFNAWYNTEHILAANRIPGVVTARRFVAVETQLLSGGGSTKSRPKYIALYDLESEKVTKSEVFLKETNSPWSTWVRSWSNRRFRILGQRIYPKQCLEDKGKKDHYFHSG